jgi:hypothetical protein
VRGSASAPRTPAKRNPYVGPRPLRSGDRLYGRNREATDIVDLLMAERIVLLHSPSGAGKTSLLQAAVIPRLQDRGFDVSGPLRVNAVPTDGVRLPNRYAWSLIVGLTGGDAAGSSQFSEMTLDDFLDSEWDRDAHGGHRVLIIDQFEEIVTLDPGDRKVQTEFFRDLGSVLSDQDRWALLSMREDYMGGLKPFEVHVPTHLKVRYRVDFLGHDAALQATKKPAAEQGVDFHRKAAEALVKDLAKVRVQLPGEQRAQKVEGPYVEPVQLQVVCTELWRQLSEQWGGELKNILPKDVKAFGDFDRALGAYFANAIADVAAETNASERVIRDWFEEKLITEEGFRNQSRAGPMDENADTTEILRGLTDQYLIRSEQRGASTWYELAHDRLIDPLCANNKEWRHENLGLWEIAADEWMHADRARTYLLGPVQLARAKRETMEAGVASPRLREFLDESQRAVNAAKREERKDRLLSRMGKITVAAVLVAVLEFVVIVVMLATR